GAVGEPAGCVDGDAVAVGQREAHRRGATGEREPGDLDVDAGLRQPRCRVSRLPRGPCVTRRAGRAIGPWRTRGTGWARRSFASAKEPNRDQQEHPTHGRVFTTSRAISQPYRTRDPAQKLRPQPPRQQDLRLRPPVYFRISSTTSVMMKPTVI